MKYQEKAAQSGHVWRRGGGGILLSTPLRNALFALFISGILAYGAGFAWYLLTHYDLVNLLRDVNGDDAFYYFQIARNLAEGKFSTFDGGITRTNGYHPIWLFLITPFYWVFDAETALFAIKAFEIMLIAGGVALITAAARLARLPWYLMFAVLPTLFQHHALFMGMEAAASLFMLGALFLTMTLFARNPVRGTWLLATVAFALPWVRLEFAAVAVAAAAMLCLIEWPARNRSPCTSSALRASVPLFGACSGILAYLTYNWLVFGGPVPVSGATKRLWSQNYWKKKGEYNLMQNFQDTLQIPAFGTELVVALGICICVLLILWFTRRIRGQDDRLLLIFLTSVFGLAMGHVAKFAQTVLTIDPIVGNYLHYFVPAYLKMALIVPITCYVALHLVRRFAESRLGRAAAIPRIGIVTGGAVALLIQADFTGPFQHVNWKSESSRREWEITSYLGAQVMNRVLPEDSVVGSRDAGVIGYFSRFPVVNLDGVVNSWDYMRALREGTEAEFRQQFGITHFANLTRVNRRVNATLFEGPPYLYSNENGQFDWQFKLWLAKPPEVPSDKFDNDTWFWQRMEPHFDWQQGDVGLTVDGRIAQIFAKNCAPDDLAIVFWTGQNGVNSFSVTPLKKNDGGLCVAAMLLPHGVGSLRRVATRVGEGLFGNRPSIRADWDVYLVENGLIYVKDSCSPEDTEPRFFLHVFPADERDLPRGRRKYGFDNLDSRMEEHTRAGRRCIAKRRLPDYPIAKIRTGQFTGEDQLWKGTIAVAESNRSPPP